MLATIISVCMYVCRSRWPIIFANLINIDFPLMKRNQPCRSSKCYRLFTCWYRLGPILKNTKYMSYTEFLRYSQLNTWRMDFHTWEKNF